MNFREGNFLEFFKANFRRLVIKPFSKTYDLRLTKPVVIEGHAGAKVGEIISADARISRILISDQSAELLDGQRSPFFRETLELK